MSVKNGVVAVKIKIIIMLASYSGSGDSSEAERRVSNRKVAGPSSILKVAVYCCVLGKDTYTHAYDNHAHIKTEVQGQSDLTPS